MACTCGRVSGPVFSAEQCRRCWKQRYDPAYAQHHGTQLAPLPCPPKVRKIDGLTSGRSFNGSLAEWCGRTFLVYRKYWDAARLALVELDEDFAPRGIAKMLSLGKLPQDRDAQEDPRLFVHRGQLYVCYTGCNWRLEQPVSVCVGRLDDSLDIVDSFCPHFPQRASWEKNWSFFDNEGDLYAIYEINPHRAILINRGKAWELPRLRTHTFAGNAFELMRGGAPPVLYNGEYYSFFHGTPRERSRPYSIGVYTFAAQPPFYPSRWCPIPLLRPDESDHPGPHVAKVVFPGGAIVRDGEWHVAYGYYDQEIRVASWDAADIEKLLVKA